MATINNIAAYINILIFQSPTASCEPARVDVTTEGNLANVEIKINICGFIGNNPDTYTSKSLGVPGIKNNTNIIISIPAGF